MSAHCHGQIWNSSRFASSCGVADTTVRRYLDLLTSTLVVRQCGPWLENVGKRQVRSPKVYLTECYFWATQAGAELDLLVIAGNQRLGFEIKRTVSPRISRSLRSAIDTLGLERAFVVHGGNETFPLAPNVEAVAASRLLLDLEPLG